LKETASIKKSERINTPAKAKVFIKPIEPINETCPLTIGSIIILKAQIIELKQNICGLNEEIAGLIEERNEMVNQLEFMKDKESKEKVEV
jgi:hypothetical protein